MRMMQKDIKFLNKHNLMDYSLLLLIENNPDFVNIANKRGKVDSIKVINTGFDQESKID